MTGLTESDMASSKDEGKMNTARKEKRRHIFISGPIESLLDGDDRRKQIWIGIQTAIKSRGYEITAFESYGGGLGHAARRKWSFESVIEVMRRCVGVVLFGFPVAWNRDSNDSNEGEGLASEYCHYEGALAVLLGLPVLALIEEGTAERGAFAQKSGFQPLKMPVDASVDWPTQHKFKEALENWDDNELKKRRDLFLGYSSSADNLALTLRTHLQNVRNPPITTLDWSTDFVKGSNLFSEFEKAAKKCSAAILLFTEADQLLAKGNADQPSPSKVPRDNVVFEAGYFAHAKSKERVLIILERGVKLPSDLDGDLRLEFDGAFDNKILAEIDDWIDKRLLGDD